ncbi:ABC transporter permease [Fluoribacter dumoffii]|uniref:Uncharacterized protein n=1 Tax=Fluoribacter dumoffii TaxID=463 RepID=A0A377GEZ1_9GAMM|nr:hypothetical protein [Fluoribacter dumoffii]KTC91212.1 hypothetical protein Ldum_2280 [Fluoribacter dumoffii NY 23]MCW8387620.1 ABC transporter permease [Fluoribacter dumoffii]MCW8416835.1 ABC transporter permease [Fluoribacter dumoffii]MCW8455325.1 ABC transporter permease [Fluoribacter dumoffii]MCW8460597.1 ABC transporter permease [Fluoribacter dumoffii]
MEPDIQDEIARFDTHHSLKITILFVITLLLSLGFLLLSAPAAARGKSTDESERGAARIEAILISDTGNSDGYVTEGKAAFPPTQVIYLTVHISKAFPGIKVEAFIINPERNIITSGKNFVTRGGNIAKAFKFNYANGKWPSGNYKVEVRLSSGDTRVTTFKLEK